MNKIDLPYLDQLPMPKESKSYKNGIRKVFIQTYGCQMNKYDSEVMAGLLKDKGYELSEKPEEADFILLNTCSVREHAEQRVYGRIGQLKELKRRNPSLILGISGCMAERQGINLLKTFPYLNLVLGTHNLHKLPTLLEEIEKERKSIVDVSVRPEMPGLEIRPWRESRLSALLPVMRGCDNFCSYCIVPYVRGRQRSRPKEDIIREVKNLAEEGYEEVTLLGQKVSAYGKDLKEEIDFADLLEEVQRNSGGIERIRFTTSHPREISFKLIKKIKDLEKVVKHIHLPFQAGSNSVLKRMDRGYTKEFYEEVVTLVRKEMPECALTTDIIVGFPGESEEDFCQTLELVEKIKFGAFFAFKYSSRPGTKASHFQETVPEEIKKERLKRLMDLQKKVHSSETKDFLRQRRRECCGA